MPANPGIMDLMLDANVTLNLVIICFSVASVAVAITLWAIATFQTKTEARATETRSKEDLTEFSKQMSSLRKETRDDIKAIWNETHAIRSEYGSVAKDIAYIRGRLEPRPPTEVP